MSSVVIVSEDKEAFTRESAFEIIAKTYPRIIFIDTELLKEQESGIKPKRALHHIK